MNTLLHKAAALPQVAPTLSRLIADGVDDINAQDKDGNTPLHIAFLRKNNEAIVHLLHAKANPHILNNEGKTPLDLFKE